MPFIIKKDGGKHGCKCASGVLGGAILGGLGGADVTFPTVVGVPGGVIGRGLSCAAAAC